MNELPDCIHCNQGTAAIRSASATHYSKLSKLEILNIRFYIRFFTEFCLILDLRLKVIQCSKVVISMHGPLNCNEFAKSLCAT